MKDLLIKIVKALVDNPEQVHVNEIVSVQADFVIVKDTSFHYIYHFNLF